MHICNLHIFIAKYKLDSAIYVHSIPRPDVVLNIQKVKASKKLRSYLNGKVAAPV
jgi:hypothetical protein